MGIGLPEIAIILVILLVVFGAKKLPAMGRGLGSGMREFKEGIAGTDDKPEHLSPPGMDPGVPGKPASEASHVVTPDAAASPVPDPDAPASERTDA